MSTKKSSSRTAITRVIISSLLIGLTVAITAAASTGGGFKFIDSVSAFFGLGRAETSSIFKEKAAEPVRGMVNADGLAPEAGELLAWNTFGNLGTETTEPSVINDANVAAANLTLGSVTAAANGNRFGGNNWFDAGDTSPTTLAESIVDNDYIQFIVTPASGFSFTPTSFVFIWDRSGTGPSGVTLRSSADGFTNDLGSVTGISSPSTASNTITISGLTNLTAATTFRLYGYGATATGGTGGFDTAASAMNVRLVGTTAPITYTITASAGPGGIINPSGAVSVNHGANQSFDIIPNIGYHIADVLYDGNSQGTPGTVNLTNITANHTLSATFAGDQYTVTYDANGGTGAPTDPSSPYTYPATVTVLGPGGMTRSGYTFTGWNTLANGTGTSRPPASTFALPASNTTLFAQWTPATPTINVTGGPFTFVDTPVGGLSAEQSYQVSATNLTDNLVINSSGADFQVSTTSGSGFGSSVSLTPSSGTVASTTIYVRFTPGSAGLKTGDISNASTGATTQTVGVSGTGTTNPYYRSRVASGGDWNDANTWEVSPDGATNWVRTTIVPTAANSNGIRILDFHNVEIAGSANADQLTIDYDATLLGQDLTIENGPGTDATITGFMAILGVLELRGALDVTGLVRPHIVRIMEGGAVTGTWAFQWDILDSTLEYAGTSPQTTTSIEFTEPTNDAPINLIINNPAGVTLHESRPVPGTLTLANGTLTTGANTLTMGASSTVVRTSGHVIGNLQKIFTANGTKTFEVGTANGYSPVSVNATAGTYPAGFIVKAAEGKAPYVPGTNALARYWTLTSPGSITADLTFDYLPTDITGSFASYEFIKNTGGTVTTLAPSATPTNTSATINGVSSFSEWTLAEPSAILPGSLAFSASNYDTSETDADHAVTVTVQRTGGAGGPVSVHYQTSDGTALLADNDYTAASGDLNWAAGETADKTFTVTVKGDNTVEPDEALNVTLSAPTGGATLGSPNPATITIQNDDTAYTISASKTGNGTISPTGAVTVNEGDDQAFAITPDANNHIASILVDGSPVANTSPYTFTNVTANHTIVANFALDQYDLVYNGNGNTGGTAPATQTADYGSTVVIAGAGSLVRAGFTFNGWNTAIDGSGTAYPAGANFVVPAANTTLYAQWTANTPVVTVVGGPLAFGDVPVGGISAVQSYQVSATDLTANLIINSPSAEFEISTNSTVGFGGTINIAPTSGTILSTPIYVRFTPGSTGLKTGDISNASTGATTQNVGVSGTGAAGAYYRSKQSGQWSAAGTWEVSPDGVSGWVDTTITPTAANSSGITVLNTHTVSLVVAAETADQLTIDAGGRINVGSTLTISNGTGTDATINGILSVAGGLELGGTLTNSGSVTILGGYRQFEGGAATGTAFAFALGSALEYAGTTEQTTTAVEFPSGANLPSNLYINNPGGVVLHANRNVPGLFWLMSGTLTTDATKLLTVTNLGAGSVMGGSATSYVKGPLARRMPTNLTGSSTYAFPVGKGSFNQLEMIDPHTAAGPTVKVEVFDDPTGGFGGAGIEALRDRYWSADVTSGGFVDTQVRLTEPGLANGFDKVGFNGDGTPAGIYLSKGGTVAGGTITSTLTSFPPGFYAVGNPAPKVEADPFPLDFGNQILLTQSSEQTLTVTNTGSDDLIITGAALTGTDQGDFAVTSGPASYPVVLGAGLSTTYGIRFTPSGLGMRTAALRISSNAINSVQYDAELTGNGTAAPTYTITASSGANGTVTPAGATTVSLGGSQTYTITPDAGYHIVDVLVDGGSVGAVGSYTFNAVAANHTISATFAINTYTITASAGANGSISPSGAVSVNHGASQAFTITPNANYHIVDVVVDSVSQGAVGNYTFSNVTANHTISATFAINTYTITASAGANGSISPSGAVSVDHGDSQTFTITPDSAYHVADVLVDGISVGAVTSHTFTNVTANHTIAASFAIDTFTLVYDANGGTGTLIDPSSPYNAGSTVTILAPGGITRTGYTFTEWNTLPDGSGTTFNPASTFTIFGNTTLYAQWTINQYSVIYDGNGSTGGAAPATQTADYNTPVTISGAGSLVRTGYTFAGWNTAANGSGTPYAAGASFTIPASNTTLFAQWTINTYTITVTQGANGTIAPGTTTVNFGDDPAFTITPDAGYHIVDVTVDGGSAGAVGSYTFNDVSANHTITASFAINTYTITASAGANGSISPSGAVSVDHGDNQLFTITPDGGYNVANVLVDGISVGAVTSHTFTNVTANHTISATFVSGTQPLVVYVDDDWAGTTPGTDPDASGPATSFGYDAFATIQAGIAGVATGGEVIVAAGSYTGDVDVNRAMDVSGVFTLSGALTVSAPGASVSPGFSPGIINSGNLSLTSGSTVNIEINGPIVGTQYDQLNVTGTVSLGGAALNTTVGVPYNPSAGQAFTIVNNDGADAVTGTFAGLPEGTVFYSGTTSFQISYAGGSNNNDVVLTTVALCNTVSITNPTTLSGNAVIASVNVDDTTGHALQSTDFTISYDPAVVTFASASLGTVTAGSVLNINSSTPGTLVVSIFNATPFSGAGSMLDITFNAVGQPGAATPVAFTAFEFNEGTECISTVNGSVTVVSGAITGVVTYGNSIPAATRHVPNTTIDAVGSVNASALTDLAGAYSISSLRAGSYTVTPSKTGDVNGSVTAFDSAQIAMWVVGTSSLNSTQLAVADVSGTGGVSSFDAALIARFAVNLPNAGSSGSWRFTPTSRSYANINVDRTGDYTALLMGDVSGNWIDPLATRPASTEAAKPISIAAARQSAATGSEVTVPVEIGDTTAKGILSYEFELRYDSAVLEPAIDTADVVGTISEGYSVTVNRAEPGSLRVVVFGAQPLAGEGRLIKLKFGVIGATGAFSDLTWERVALNEGGFDITASPGRVEVTPSASSDATLTGRVTTAEGQAITNARVKLTDTSGVDRTVATNGFGFFQFTGLQIGQTYTVNVSAKRHRFTSRIVSISGDAVNIDIIADQ